MKVIAVPKKRYDRKQPINWNEEPVALRLRPYKLKDLADLYGMCTKTFRKWMEPFEEEIGERNGYFFRPEQVRIIFSKLRPPSFLDIEEM